MNAAWTPPLDPPTANVDAPINVGSIDQVKSAGLSVDALSVIGGSMGITSPGPRIKMTNTSTVPPSFDWWLYANGPSFYLIADRDGNGNWNTPAEAPWPMQVVVGATSTSDFVKFSNAVRSPKYCDEVGLNCFDAAEVDAAMSGAIGVGQTWQNMISSRYNGWIYQNTTGKPIQIAVDLDDMVAARLEVSNDGSNWMILQNSDGSAQIGASAIIPNNGYYRVWGPVGWLELR